MPQVSVIVLTYNPNPVKLRQTLAAITTQRSVDLEIIISDDGSSKKDFSFLSTYMDSLNTKNYQLLEHTTNRGTVANCLSAVKAAMGEYIFFTSPGDLLFDEYVLRDFYQFAKQNHTPLCFGNVVFYNLTADGPKITREFGTPAHPQLYKSGISLSQNETAFFGGNWVIGASYFRSRDIALKYLEKISDSSVYMEDTPSTAFALADGLRLSYFDRNILWYEDGSGVSTGTNNKWEFLLKKDLQLSLSKLKAHYPANPYIDIAYRNATIDNRNKRILGNLLRHPITMLRLAFYKRYPNKPIIYSKADLDHLNQLLKTT